MALRAPLILLCKDGLFAIIKTGKGHGQERSLEARPEIGYKIKYFSLKS